MPDNRLPKIWKWIWNLLSNFIETIPPRDLTITRIRITELRIRDYWDKHGRLPASLSDLPLLKGRDNTTMDGWGQPIKYSVKGTSIVTLSSLNADWVDSDARFEQDISVTFDVSKEAVR